MFKDNLLSIKNNESSWMAITLAIPTYLIVFIGTAPILQGVFYLIYLLGLYFLWKRRQQTQFSNQFILCSLIFLIAWILPNIITMNSGRLESEMLSLPVLVYHAIVFFIIIVWGYSWTQTKQPAKDWQQFCKTLFTLLVPIVLLILIESIRLRVEFPNRLASPFNYRHLIGEVLLMFMLTAFAFTGKWVKVIITALIVIILTLIQNRGGLLSVGIIIVLYMSVKILNHLTYKQILLGLFLVALLAFLFYSPLFNLVDYFFMLEHKVRGLGSGFTHRLPIWIDTWQEIQRVPWTGVGFWVSPYPYGDHFNPGRAVHNIFLRLWVENGTGLLTVVLIVLIATAIQIEYKKLHWHRMAFWSILAYYFFIPRHLTLNPLSILLYWTIIQSLCLPGNRKIK